MAKGGILTPTMSSFDADDFFQAALARSYRDSGRISERSHSRKSSTVIGSSKRSSGRSYYYQTWHRRNSAAGLSRDYTNRRAAARVRSADIRAREARSALIARRAERAYARGEAYRRSDLFNSMPEMLSGILGILFTLIFLVHLLGLIISGTDVMNILAGNTSDVLQTDGFYQIGAKNAVFSVVSSSGTEIEASGVKGKYVSISETIDWVEGLVADAEEYVGQPIAYAASVFWNFITDTLGGFVTGNFGIVGEAGQNILDSIQNAIGGLVDGISEWWNQIFGSGSGSGGSS